MHWEESDTNEKGAGDSKPKRGLIQKSVLLGKHRGLIERPECNEKEGKNDWWKKQIKSHLAENF